MKRILILLTTFLTLFIYSCDTTENSFDDTLPDLLTLSLIASPEEGGTLIPAKIEFVKGEEVEIEAISANGFMFEQWKGDFEGESNPATLVMTDNKAVTAIFREIRSLITIETTGEGTVVTDFDGQTVSLSAMPSTGWAFSHWDGDLSGTKNPDILYLDEEKSVTAVFDPQFKLTVSVDGEGTVNVNPEQEYFNNGDSVTLTATPESGWRFSRWEGDISGNDNPIQVIMDRDKSTNAVFVLCLFC